MRKTYQEMVGSALYLAMGSRPNIMYAVVCLSRFTTGPAKEHLEAPKYLYRYLNGTADYCIHYDSKSLKGLVGFSDSDWAGLDVDIIDQHSRNLRRRSITGNIFSLAGGPITWHSHTQKTIALSSTEAEYMALSDASRQAVWLKSLLLEIGFNTGPVTLAGDNQGSIFIAQNSVTERRSKHIDIRYHYVREKILDGEVELRFIPGTENPADILTKSLAREKFESTLKLTGLKTDAVKYR